MIYKNSYPTVALLLTMLLTFNISCKEKEDLAEVRNIAESFADLYFNWRYVEAMEYVDSSCIQKLRFVASQVTDNDLRFFLSKENAANVEVMQVVENSSDNITVTLLIENFLQKDTIGRPPVLREGQEISIQLARKDKHSPWLVTSW